MTNLFQANSEARKREPRTSSRGNLYSKFQEEVMPKLKEEFELANNLSMPKIEKVVINMGMADALTGKDVIDKVTEQMSLISGQKPKLTKAKKAISSFKLKQGDIIGAKVTLRGKRAWQFLEKFISVAIPRLRDFRGISPSNFDKYGNYTFGLSEQIIFPEIDYAKIDKIRGLMVTISIKNTNPEKSRRLLELLGLPLKHD